MQREEKNMRDIELAQRKGRQQRQGELEFRCRKCDEYACMSSDIRTVERMHHVVIDLDFRERHNERPSPKPDHFGGRVLPSSSSLQRPSLLSLSHPVTSRSSLSIFTSVCIVVCLSTTLTLEHFVKVTETK